MKAQTVLFRTRVNQERLSEANTILEQLGLTPGDALNALLAQIVLRRSLPFSIALDNPQGSDAHSLLPSQEQGRIWEEAFGEY